LLGIDVAGQWQKQSYLHGAARWRPARGRPRQVRTAVRSTETPDGASAHGQTGKHQGHASKKVSADVFIRKFHRVIFNFLLTRAGDEGKQTPKPSTRAILHSRLTMSNFVSMADW
jgi:hypothetical protein